MKTGQTWIEVAGNAPNSIPLCRVGHRLTMMLQLTGLELSNEPNVAVLNGQMPLDEMIGLNARGAAETGQVMISVHRLLLGS